MKYKKKPVTIEAVQWTGSNEEEIKDFVGVNAKFEYLFNSSKGYVITPKKPSDEYTITLRIDTLEGKMTASPGDYVIKGVNGEFYPCKPDIFEKTYDKVEDSEGTYISRMYDELKELVDKYEKCTKFVISENFREVVKEDYSAFLLWLQNYIMERYVQVLSCRINAAEGAEFNTIPRITFDIAVKALQFGINVRRASWNKGLYIIKQVPAHITKDVIPRMQSLPESAKELIANSTNFITYTSQCLIFNSETGEANSWSPSVDDMFADDWELNIK